MSIRPLSHTEMKNLREAIENNGWQIRGLIENYFRYSIKKDKILIFTIKYPVNIPLRINIPFEVANFRISFAFKLWDLNTNSNKLIIMLLKLLRNLAIQISLEHDFPIKGKETEFLEILNLLMPEPIKDENDNTWINRIRISLMNKRDEFSEFDTTKLNVIVQILKNIGLNPTFKLPWELKKGVPKIRSSETLFFSNEEKYDEFFILEKGFFTYFKDLEYKKFYIRSSFQTYTPYILFRLFNEIDFKQGQLIEKWIKFSRLLINSVIEIIDIAKVNQQELIKFNPERELTSDDYEEGQNNFPFSALHYESSLSKRELYTIHNDLFNTPPANFEVIETMKTYYRAEELLKNYRFEESTELFNDALKIFNKNRQKKIVAAILLKLSKIGLLLNQNDIALNYLQTALGIAKSGDVPIECIIRIHYNLGITFFQLKDLLKARQHFEVITNFLEKEHSFSERDEFLGLAYLYLGLITAEFNELADSKSYFKKTLQTCNNSIKVKLNYHLLRAQHFKGKNNLSQAQKFLKAGIDSVGIDYNNEHQEILFDLILDLAEFYIHYRVDSRKALYLLKNVENRLSFKLKEIPGIKRATRWNLLMTDYYEIVARDNKKTKYYYQQAQLLINQLKKIGITV